MKGTGGYEWLVVAALQAASLPVVVMNPWKEREFARATGQLAKIDAIDASTLARVGRMLRPEIRPIPDENTRIMWKKLGRRRQLIVMRTVQKNRQDQSRNAPVRQGIQSHLDFLDKQIEEIDKELEKTIVDSPACREKAERGRIRDDQHTIRLICPVMSAERHRIRPFPDRKHTAGSFVARP